MSFWRKSLAAVGVGGAKVSLELAAPHLTAGGTVDAVVRIRGGAAVQSVNECSIELCAEYTGYATNAQGEQRARTKEAVIQSYAVHVEGPLHAGALHEIPLTLSIPLHAPPRLYRETIRLRTRLDLDRAVDSIDHDEVEVLADPLLQRVLNAMSRLRFPFKRSYLTENGDSDRSPDAYVQRVVYSVPVEYSDEMDGIMLTPVWMDDALHLDLLVDWKQGLLRSLTGQDIATERLVLRPEEWAERDGDALASYLQDSIVRTIAKME
jgi:sporulation-control protein